MELKLFCRKIFNEKPDAFTTIIKKRLPTVFNTIIKYPGNSNIEKFYNYYHNNNFLTKCKNKDCDNNRSWRKKLNIGYSNYCSLSCSNKDPDLIKIRKDSYLNNGGFTIKTRKRQN